MPHDNKIIRSGGALDRTFGQLLVAMASSTSVTPHDHHAATTTAAAAALALQVAVHDIVTSREQQAHAKAHGLQLDLLTWEDTARDKGSCFGDNISDMTLAVIATTNTRLSGEWYRTRLMPIVRLPNFRDVTGDVDSAKIHLTVGNHVDGVRSRVSLQTFLDDIHAYTSARADNIVGGGACGRGPRCSLWRPRDAVLLTSAQCCVVPENAHFAVQLRNYQSRSEAPAVLVILASQCGTSVQVLRGREQVLYHDLNGVAFDFEAVRLRDDRRRRGKAEGDVKVMDSDEKERNALLVIQVPLLQPPPPPPPLPPPPPTVHSHGCGFGFGAYEKEEAGCTYEHMVPESNSVPLPDDGSDEDDWGWPDDKPAVTSQKAATTDATPALDAKPRRGAEFAMLSAGRPHGAYPSLADVQLERDADKPIRMTVQLYQCTDTPKLDADFFRETRQRIVAVVHGASVDSGSLVTEARGERATEATTTTTTVGHSKSATFHATLAALSKIAPTFSF